jgi:hypothetical protein
MANEIILPVDNGNDIFYQFEGGGGLSGTGRFHVGYSYATSRKLTGAIRFQNVQIPKDSVGINAGIHLYAQEKIGNKEIFIKAWGIDEDNTSDFTSYPLGRTKTTASNTHNWNGNTGEYFTIGVGNIIEEIVSRSGWNPGNSIGFIIEDNGTSTADSGGYLYDELDDSKRSFLDWRVGPEPNFTPTPKSVAAPTFPAVDSYGMKISYPGYDVLTATEAQLYFTTRKREYKIIAQGKITTTAGVVYNIAHGLSYKPCARAFFKSISSVKRYKIPRFIPGEIQDPDADTTNGQIEVDATNVKIMTTDACEVYYYIYIDELAT